MWSSKITDLARYFRKSGVRWFLNLTVIVFALLQPLGLFPSTLLDRIDVFFYDVRMRMQPANIDPRIVIVNIDSKSLEEVGRWPWSRDVVAELTKVLTDTYEVRVAGFDVLFTEPDQSSGYTRLAALADKELKNYPKINDLIEKIKPSLDFDARLSAAMQDKPIVLGYYLSNDRVKGALPDPAFDQAVLRGLDVDVFTYKGFEGNLAALQKAARGGGFINTDIDQDGIIRSVPLLARVGDGFYESLALATVRAARGAPRIRPMLQDMKDYGAIEAIKIATLPKTTVIPVGPFATTLVPYHGRGGPEGGSYRYVSASDVLKRRVDKSLLEDKIVLIGSTAPGLFDLRSTPVNSVFPGIEIHANIIASILDKDFKQLPPFVNGFDAVQIIVVGIVLAVCFSLLSPTLSILAGVVGASAVLAFNLWMYQSFSLVLPVATALLTILGLFVVNTAWGFMFEYRTRRQIVGLFGEYVAPALVAEMVVDPTRYNMKGKSSQLSVMFSDVRGFTSIAEGLSAQELQEYINEYLTEMSECIQSNRGTLDKYIGDAVMAFWGAPIFMPNHAELAVSAALEMQRRTAKLNAMFVKRDWPELKIGIGINTGEVRVGDMGSSVRRAYTVMGDAVNIASRLEGVTKVYGVGIMVGELTKEAATAFSYRELDKVRVKGKAKPVSIYEPLGLTEELGQETIQWLTLWDEALKQLRLQEWDVAEKKFLDLKNGTPLDYACDLYVKRIAHYRTSPPGKEWDGVTTFETK